MMELILKADMIKGRRSTHRRPVQMKLVLKTDMIKGEQV
jgi:hypothetical protein